MSNKEIKFECKECGCIAEPASIKKEKKEQSDTKAVGEITTITCSVCGLQKESERNISCAKYKYALKKLGKIASKDDPMVLIPVDESYTNEKYDPIFKRYV